VPRAWKNAMSRSASQLGSAPVRGPDSSKWSSAPPPLLYAVYFIYFFCGLTLCFEGAFNPEFKDYFHLTYQQQMYTMFAKNIPFALAVGIGMMVPAIGYKNCLTIGLTLFGFGTLLLVPGLNSGQYALLLAGFFVIGLGFNFQLVAGNPLLSSLGPARDAASRLNLGNALGAVAQILGPVTLSFLIPATVTGVSEKLPYMKGLFAIIGLILVLMAVLSMVFRPVRAAEVLGMAGNADGATAGDATRSIWGQPRVLLGALAVFFVLGAEAGLFGLFRNYLEDRNVAGLTAQQSQRLFTVYFALFALGRLVGSAVQKRVRPRLTLIAHLLAALGLLAVMVVGKGTVAVVAVLLIGYFVSIFFPTLYSLAIEGLGERTAQASGLLTMGFLGCAILPVLQGRLADQCGLRPSYALCFFSYLFALFYALKAAGSSAPGSKAAL
jgi:FHS family L-fucose permease-like MFS transporter